MSTPSSVALAISGTVNGTPVSGTGTLDVDDTTGTKDGSITYTSPPPPGTPGGDSMPAGTTKCFIGAKRPGKNRFVGPLELLGPEFVSLRLTQLGRAGSASVSETARLARGVLHSTLTVVAVLRAPAGRGIGPLREVIRVSGDDTLVGEGRYSLMPDRGRPVPVQYTHFYRSLNPNRRLFRSLRGRVYLLRAWVKSKAHGRKGVKVHTVSTLRVLKDH
jgi:hypothetical protein